VANTGQAPFPVAPTPEPVPLGRDDVRRPALYAPLVFTVGQSRAVQYPAAQWEGNMLAGTEAGVTYSARDVVEMKLTSNSCRQFLSANEKGRLQWQLEQDLNAFEREW